MISRRHFLAAVPLLALPGCSRKGAEEILVGHIGPLRGEDQALGKLVQRGILLAVESLAEEPIANKRLAVVQADSRGDLERAANEAVRLATLNKIVALFGGLDHTTVDRLAQALRPYPVPLLTAGPRGAVAQDGVFALEVAPAFRGRCLANYAIEQDWGKHAVALVDVASTFCDGVASAFGQSWREKGRTLQTLSVHAEQTTARLASLKADVLLVAATTASWQKIADKATAGKPKLLFGGEPREMRKLSASDAMIGAEIYAPGHFTDDGKQFIVRYRKRHAEEPDPYVFAGYEMALVLADALRSAKGTGGVRLRDELKDGEALPGLNATFSFKDGYARRPLYIVRSGSNESLREFKPED